MNIYFSITGRLGNAIFRYLACAIFCIKYNGIYKINIDSEYNRLYSDEQFYEWMKYDLQGYEQNISENLIFNRYYQHDEIYKKYKLQILKYIEEHPEHYVLTDGIIAGDNNCQQFFIKDIIHEPNFFIKNYDIVIHIRLEDQVMSDGYIKIEFLLLLLEKIRITENSCIVIKIPTTEFEKQYLQTIIQFIQNKNGISINIESNDVLRDFHIMKNAKILVCSISTLSWAAALLSNKIEKCYFPELDEKINSSCKYPIDNTELYKI